LNNSPKSE